MNGGLPARLGACTYRLLLRLFPASFRAEYGEEMCAVFAKRQRDENAFLLWLSTIFDIASNALRVHGDLLHQDLVWTFRTLRQTPGSRRRSPTKSRLATRSRPESPSTRTRKILTGITSTFAPCILSRIASTIFTSASHYFVRPFDWSQPTRRLGQVWRLSPRVEWLPGSFDPKMQGLVFAPDYPFQLSILGHALAKSGEKDKAEEILQRLLRHPAQPEVDIATLYLGLENIDETLRWLESAPQRRNPHLLTVPSDPRFTCLHKLPRFREILRQMGLSAKAA